MKLSKFKFHNDIIEVINGNVSVNAICRNLGVDRKAQQSKIQLDPSFESKFEDVEINGIIQSVLCIPLSKLNGWLFSINPNRVKPEVKQKLIEYKNECFDVLYNHFNKTPRQLPHAEIEELKETILAQNTIIAKLHKELKANSKPNSYEVGYKTALIDIHNSYHLALTTRNPADVKRMLREMTNCFQTVSSIENDGKNLNTQTIAKHSYWK